MIVAVLGASGIVGQHMRLCVPPEVTPIFFRRRFEHNPLDRLFEHIDLGTNVSQRAACLSTLRHIVPDVIVNLAGDGRTDAVQMQMEAQRDPAILDGIDEDRAVNVLAPGWLADYCDAEGAHLIHVSSQAVFSGNQPPYGPQSERKPVNEYGRQKMEAEDLVMAHENWTIVRLTFLLGVRPLPTVGRPNPLEQMLASNRQRQVNDRWFSILFARDAAELLWDVVVARSHKVILHFGLPDPETRYSVAGSLNGLRDVPSEIVPVAHDSFPGLAPRPLNTVYSPTAYKRPLLGGLTECVEDWKHRRARELALFFSLSEQYAQTHLAQGFGFHHANVAKDFRTFAPETDEALLQWYRCTRSYCWELSAYHADVGFNYQGMCDGIAQHLRTHQALRVWCLGDGIGDLTLTCAQQRGGDRGEGALDPVYHDLANSVTAQFALFRFALYGVTPLLCLTEDWSPPPTEVMTMNAVVALDFFEHLPNVEEWVRAVYHGLIPGGWFLAQNAFGIGDNEHEGSIPMHLVRNNKYVTEWEPLLESVGFERAEGGWWRKP